MICLHCGYCCINYAVIIVDNPELGIVENNLIFHEGLNKPCKHLRGDKPGNYTCAIHNCDFYKDTPCFSHTQIEFENTECRIGKNILDNMKK